MCQLCTELKCDNGEICGLNSDGSVRLIEIKRCCDCPRSSRFDWYCNQEQRVIQKFGNPIPEWCPLPKARNSNG